jgi:hypothetical protein
MPSPQLQYTMTIHRVNGDPLRFNMVRSLDQLRNAGTVIENGLSASYLGVVLDGRLRIVPAHQIAEIEIDPAPNALIAHVIKDVTPCPISKLREREL